MSDRLGPFEVLEEQVGSGATRIWRCAGEEGGAVVVEQFLPPLSRSQRFLDAVMAAARACEAVEDAHLAPVIWTQPIDGVPTLAESRVPGHDLRAVYNQAYRQRASMPVAFSTRVLADAARGFSAAGRAHTLCHGGVAPQNIWVTRRGHGVAIHVPRACLINRAFFARPDGPLQGSYTYASPEQLHGRAPTPRTDVFGLGIVLYEMTTGARLFKRRTAEEAREAVLACKVEPPSNILPGYPPALERIVLTALERQPAERWADPEQMAQALEREVLDRMGDARAVVQRFVERLFPEPADLGPNRRPAETRGSDRPAVRIIPRGAAPPPSPPPPQPTRARSHFEREPPVEPTAPSEPPSEPTAPPRPHAPSLQTTGALPQPLREGPSSRPVEAEAATLLEQEDELPTEIREAAEGALSDQPSPREKAPPIWPPDEAEAPEAPTDGRRRRPLALVIGLLLVGAVAVWAWTEGHVPLRLPSAGAPARETAAKPEDPAPSSGESADTVPAEPSTPAAPKEPPGRLALWVEPWAEVRLNGKDLGLTPLPEAEIPAGEHRLVIVNQDLNLKWTGEVDVKPGTTTRLHVDLRKPEDRRLSYAPVGGESEAPSRRR